MLSLFSLKSVRGKEKEPIPIRHTMLAKLIRVRRIDCLTS